MEEITDNLFVKEMQILWQNTDDKIILGNIIRDYFGLDRGSIVIGKMQEKISD